MLRALGPFVFDKIVCPGCPIGQHNTPFCWDARGTHEVKWAPDLVITLRCMVVILNYRHLTLGPNQLVCTSKALGAVLCGLN